MLKSVMSVVILSALVIPASANEFWVEYDYSTHVCSIVEKKTAGNDVGTSQDATAANTAPNAATPSTPSGATIPAMLPASSAPAPTTVVTPSDESGSPATSPTAAAASGGPAATSPDDKKDDPFAPTADAWAKKKAAAEAAGTADVQTALIGTAMHSREEAESEMQIMRKCGIAN